MAANFQVHIPLTAYEVRNTYYIDGEGVIRTHGEFFGEPEYVPFFYDLVKAGKHTKDINSNGALWHFTVVTDSMRSEFPGLRSLHSVGISIGKRAVLSWIISAHGAMPS